MINPATNRGPPSRKLLCDKGRPDYDDDNNIEIPLGILGESLSSNRRVVIIPNITVFTGIERFLIDDGGDFKFRPCRSSRPDTAVRGDSMRF